MRRIRFVMLGGFLGAGKTTAIARLGRSSMARGQRVALVTNDQAADLVDTHSLRAQGFPVQEVPGACFCCRFDDLVGRVEVLRDTARPDVILAEPVGSCTDLVATVVQPLKDLHGEHFQVAPYVVLFKPSHGLPILRNEAAAGFSPKAAYIFRKQLEEADVIAINRIDEIDPARLQELIALVRDASPSTPVLPISARTGQGFEALAEVLDQEGNFGQKILDIDYDIYAEGEAELGWLNSSAHIAGREAFSLDAFLLEVIRSLRSAMAAEGCEVAHLKAIGLSATSFGVANLVSSGTEPELSLPSHACVQEADIIINARVATEPSFLDTAARDVLQATCQARGAAATFGSSQSFRPGRPRPTHRYTSTGPKVRCRMDQHAEQE
jgi:Ni2+-binding GTPase involved in maturation of urease and hydrogenase